MARDTMPEHVTLGGRQWQPAEVTTARHDDWMMMQVAAAGLDGLTAREDAREMLARAIASRTLDLLLAGLLVELDPAGSAIPWTEARARDAAECFAGLTDPAEKRTRRDLLVRLLIPFFPHGLGSSGPSPSSSTRAAGASRAYETAPVLASSNGDPLSPS